MDKLKPCPFCGGEAILSHEVYVSPKFRYDKDAMCIAPGKYLHSKYKVKCETPRCFARNNTVVFHSKPEAIEAWNRRADDEQVPQRQDPRV